MSQKLLSNKAIYTILFFVIVIIVTSIIAVPLLFPNNNNPITSLPNYGKAVDFTLPNINNQNYTFSSDQGLVRILAFIYTKCPGTQGCALISANMASLEQMLIKNNVINDTRLITIDFDYRNDTMQNLRSYAANYTNNYTRWQFLFGNSTQTLNVTRSWGFYFAVNNATATPGGPAPEPYIHSLQTYIIDKNGFIRDIILGSSWDVGITGVYDAVSYLIHSS